VLQNRQRSWSGGQARTP